MKYPARLLLIPLAMISAWAIAATPQRIDSSALGMFAGTWRSQGSFTAPGAKTATHTTGTNDCKWSSSMHLFLVCNGAAHVEGVAATQYQLSVYTYDATSKRYRFAGITANDDVASPDFDLRGNTWSYSGKFSGKDGKIHWFRTLNIFDSPDRYRYESQISVDGQHWTTTASGVSSRT